MKNFVLCQLAFLTILHADPLWIHVSPQGDDTAFGSKEAPFASLERARDEIRTLKKDTGLPAEGVVVWLHGGVHNRTETFVLGTDDSGEAGAPVAYRSQPGESAQLSSGRPVPVEAWKPLSPQAAKRVHPKVEVSALFEVNYDALGVKNGERLAKSSQSSGAPECFVLFANGRRQTLSQWPNLDEKITDANDPGWATPNGTRDNHSFHFAAGGKPANGDTTNEIDLDGTERSKRWMARLESGNDLWLRGHWRTPWAPRLSLVSEINLEEKWIRLADIPPGGMGSKYTKTFTAHDGGNYRMGSGAERFYALNLLEEIDQPGEYAIDFKDRRIYFYPPADLKSLKLTIADSSNP
ncbi:MAG: hypothetical protein AAGB14_15855, partial [Verrucomicrobiota bacterium]